jgi:EmrB/QacA subfamily drug resistance transporter
MTAPPVARPAAGPAAPDDFSIRAILAPVVAIVLGTFMAILDTTVVNVALPTLGRVFAAELGLLQWVITAYMLAQAAVIPLSGWFSDRFGAKRIYLTALVLFTLGSALCAAAWSAPMLVLFRVLQGLGGGMLMPVGMAFLYRLAPPDRRGAVMGAFGVPMLLGPALGPVLAGWFLEFADWRWIFLINVPVGALAVFYGLRALPALPAQGTVGGIDLLGFVLGPLAFASLSYGIGESSTEGWGGASNLTGIAVGLVALVLFVARELTAREPLLELRVFRSRAFSLAILAQWCVVVGLFGTMFLLPLFLQGVRGYGPLQTGLITLPQALTAAVVMPIGGRLFDAYGVRVPALGGLALAMGSMWLFSRITAETTGTDLLLPLVLQGAGMGLMMMPLGTQVLNSAPRDLVSRVTSLTGALQNLVASLAIATFATLLQASAAGRLAELGPSAGVGSQAAVQALAFGDVFRAALVVLGLSFLLVLTLRRPPARAVRGDGREPAAMVG